jgi:hypothetical protein
MQSSMISFVVLRQMDLMLHRHQPYGQPSASELRHSYRLGLDQSFGQNR